MLCTLNDEEKKRDSRGLRLALVGSSIQMYSLNCPHHLDNVKFIMAKVSVICEPVVSRRSCPLWLTGSGKSRFKSL